jgi:hypothetical protein
MDGLAAGSAADGSDRGAADAFADGVAVIWSVAWSFVYLLIIAAYLAWLDRGLRAAGRRGFRRGRARLLLLTLAAIWAAQDVRLLSWWASTVLTLAVEVLWWLDPYEDDDHRPRRRRLRTALKRARDGLARGIPARRPQEAPA